MKSIRLFVPIFNKHLNLELPYESSIWIINQIDKFFERIFQGERDPFSRYQLIHRLPPLGRSTNLILGSCSWVEKINVFISIVLNYSTILYFIFDYLILLYSFIFFYCLFYYISFYFRWIENSRVYLSRFEAKNTIWIFFYYFLFYLSEKNEKFISYFCKKKYN